MDRCVPFPSKGLPVIAFSAEALPDAQWILPAPARPLSKQVLRTRPAGTGEDALMQVQAASMAGNFIYMHLPPSPTALNLRNFLLMFLK